MRIGVLAGCALAAATAVASPAPAAARPAPAAAQPVPAPAPAPATAQPAPAPTAPAPATAQPAPAPTAPAPATAQPAPVPATDRIVVVFAPGTPAAARAAARRDADAGPGRALGSARFQLVAPAAGASTSATLRALRADPRVLAAEPERMLTKSALPDDPLFGLQWGLRNDGLGIAGALGVAGADVSAPAAWELTRGSPATVVADIDDGYRFEHPDLAAVVWTNPAELPNGLDDDGDGIVDDLHGADFVGADAGASPLVPDGDPTDDDLLHGGHGVHTAGILGAAGGNGVGVTGVAQDVRIMPLRACGPAPGTDGLCPLSAIVAAINYAGAHGARVANLSLGGWGRDPVLRAAFAANPQVLFVAAAGNDGADVEAAGYAPCGEDPRLSGVPGAVDNVVCVAASTQADTLASFSNRGARSVDLAAPGTQILSTHPRSSIWSERFEGAGFDGWTHGPDGGFARSDAAPLTSWGVTASPSAPEAGAVSIVSTSPAVTVPSGWTNCTLSLRARVVNRGGGALLEAELLRDGTAIAPAARVGSTTDRTVTLAFDRRLAGGDAAQVRLSYRLPAGATPVPGDGAWVDDLDLRCWAPPGQASGYAFLDGTSMAAPFVSGAAALLLSLHPEATVTQVRTALLDSATRIPALAGTSVTGGRLNAAAALTALTAALAAPAPGPGGGTDPAPGGDRAIPAGPAARPAPRCVVPRLAGRTLAQARVRLRRARCRLGRVTRPRVRAPRRRGASRPAPMLVVRASSPRAGSARPAGTRVALTLKAKPRRR
jgi:subtilisin family serine protease